MMKKRFIPLRVQLLTMHGLLAICWAYISQSQVEESYMPFSMEIGIERG